MRKDSQVHLVRALGLLAVIIYGVGDILGAGIYSIIGKIAGLAESYTWLSFVVAMIIVLFTALTYGELTSRFPKSGGVSVFTQHAFDKAWLSIFAGVLLLGATLFSMSTLTQAFVGYLRSFGFYLPKWLGVWGFLLILLIINIRGIKLSSLANMISTTIEVSGLLIVLVCGWIYLTAPHDNVQIVAGFPGWRAIFQGAALAFFAFTGFEDLANIAEEVKNPEVNIPRAMLSALLTAGVMYVAVSTTVTAVMPSAELVKSDAPLIAVVQKAYPSFPLFLFSFIALFAVFNTTLLNYITASRLLYGMAEGNLLPKFLQSVHKKYHTPYVSILLIFPIVLCLSLFGTLQGLAGSTSAIVLTVFTLSCMSLIKVKSNATTQASFNIPFFIPCVAVLLNIVAITFLPLTNIMTAALFVLFGFLLSSAIVLFTNCKTLLK